MTDAQIKLYAALRVAIPEPWRIWGRSDWWRGENQGYRDLIIHLERPVTLTIDNRDVPNVSEHLAHAVPLDLLEDSRFTSGTIALDVQQIVDDVAALTRR